VAPSRILAQIAATYAAHPADVLIVLGPPGITTQPINITAGPGERITNNVMATGRAPLSYQWRRNESALPGKTNASLVFTNAQLADSGNYSVIVSNTAGSITSRVATLRVLVRPSITLQPTPTNQIVVAGDPVSITVGASGTLPMSYSWRLGGEIQTNIILNSTNCTLHYTAVATNNNLSTNAWRVGITNIAGLAPGLSATAFVVVLPDSDGDHIPDFWEIGYGLSSTNAADALLDPDGDTSNNLAEYIAGTDPLGAESCLKIDHVHAGPGNAHLEFLAVSNRTYSILFRDDLADGQWSKLADVNARTTNHFETVIDPTPANRERYYRLATPKLPD